MTNEQTEVKFGYCDIRHEYIDEVEEYLKKLEISKFIIACEKVTNGTHKATEGEHMHFLLHISTTKMNTLRTHLKTKYNLGSKNSGKPFYGFSKQEIRSLERIGAYTVKDKNIRFQNYTDDEISKLIDVSFPKSETLFNQVIEHLSTTGTPFMTCGFIDFQAIEKSVLKFYMEHPSQQTITKSQIKSITRCYAQQHMPNRFSDNNFNQIYNYTIMN
jgi:hypothetical protein